MYLWQVTGRLNLSNVKEAYFTISPKLKTNKQTNKNNNNNNNNNNTIIIPSVWPPSLQIIFVYKQVICQARVKFWLDKKPVWSDKNNFHSYKFKIRECNPFHAFQYFNFPSGPSA